MGERDRTADPSVRRALEGASCEAYPKAMATREAAMVGDRRRKAGVAPDGPLAGLALSGGGIRSATFCLGVLQALAKRDLLRHIDFLSTVSGGGYTGSFLTALHLRKDVTPDTVRTILAAKDEAGDPAACAPGTLTSRNVLGWLRENGRHLAPNGSGDLFTAGAIILRNWLSVQAVMMLMVLMLFTALQFFRALAERFLVAPYCVLGQPAGSADLSQGCLAVLQAFLQDWLPFGDGLLWWSVVAVVPAALLVFAVVPFGWAYWLVGLPRRTPVQHAAPWLAVLLVLAAVVWLWRFGFIEDATTGVLFTVCALTLIVALLARRIRDGSRRRRRLSEYLRNVLVLAGVGAVVTLIDTLGQSAYLFHALPGGGISDWLGDAVTAVGGVLAAGAAMARRLTVAMSGTSAMSRPTVPKSLLASIAALVIYGLVFTSMNGVSHAVAWGLKVPVSAPTVLTDPDWSHGVARPNCLAVCAPAAAGVPASAGECDCVQRGSAHPRNMLWWTLFLLLLSFVVSWSWSFLNRSTLLPLYTARLVRAYLGASNPNRVCPTTEDGRSAPAVTVTRVLRDDDPTRREWALRAGWSLDAAPGAGGPLHLVNVTVNETVSGRSQVQQNDRRGVGLAAGPAGMSAGREHHVVLAPQRPDTPLQAQVFPRDGGDGSRPFRMFELPQVQDHSLLHRARELTARIGGLVGMDGAAKSAGANAGVQGVPAAGGQDTQENGDEAARDLREMAAELMSLSYWMGVSGAAFSTGLGYRTRLGLSLLAGFFNVRLGYWWDSGVDPARRGAEQLRRKSWLGRAFTRVFPVQSLLIDEFVARFHGPSRQWWYLTDGGHFENMGAYELIRRRLPLIIIIDAEADPDYWLEGLANLVRKARIDFGAEIRFLDTHDIDTFSANAAAGMPVSRRVLGSLDMLRRCAWDTETITGARGGTAVERSTPGASDRTGLSLACASVGLVTYADSPVQSRIIHLKPTLTGGEPVDLLHYHATEPDFPQQTTADQFFDEAQWESYRKLGEYIAAQVFADGLDPCPLPRDAAPPHDTERTNAST